MRSNFTRTLTLCLTSTVALTAAAGCASVSSPSTEPELLAVTSTPTSDAVPSLVTIDGAEVSWRERGKTAVVSIWGDSCPDELSSVDAVAIDEISVTFVSTHGDSFCFEYLRQFATEVKVPDSVTGLPLKVSVVLPADSDSKTISGFVLE